MNKYNIILIVGICILVISVAGGIMLWWPVLDNYISLKDQLDSKDSELKAKEEYFKNLSDTLNKLKGYEEQMSKVKSAFPEDLDVAVPTLFSFMEELSSKSGVMLDDVSGNPAALRMGSSTKMEEFPFNVSVSGSYVSFKNFLAAVYRNSRMIDIESIQFDASKEKKGLFEFSLSLRTYLNTGTLSQPALSEGAELPEEGTR